MNLLVLVTVAAGGAEQSKTDTATLCNCRCRGCGAKQNGLSDKALQCLLKDNVALVLVLELCVNGQQAGLSGRVCVATTHIYQNQGFPNVKMWQVCVCVCVCATVDSPVYSRERWLIQQGGCACAPSR